MFFNNDTSRWQLWRHLQDFSRPDDPRWHASLARFEEFPTAPGNGVPPTKSQMVTSFSSKSEIALNLSTDGKYVTFMGYLAPIGAIDVSNSNTPGRIRLRPTPSVGVFTGWLRRSIRKGKFQFTKTDAYSGNNGRAAILNGAANVFYSSGNAGNGGNPSRTESLSAQEHRS